MSASGSSLLRFRTISVSDIFWHIPHLFPYPYRFRNQKKCGIGYGTIIIRPNPIRFHPYWYCISVKYQPGTALFFGCGPPILAEYYSVPWLGHSQCLVLSTIFLNHTIYINQVMARQPSRRMEHHPLINYKFYRSSKILQYYVLI